MCLAMFVLCSLVTDITIQAMMPLNASLPNVNAGYTKACRPQPSYILCACPPVLQGLKECT